MDVSPITVARRLHRALEEGVHGEALRPLFTDDAVVVERPNLIKPSGACSPLEEVLANSVAGAGLLRGQRYDEVEAADLGGTAVFIMTWTGTVARDLGPFREGQVLTAHIAQFVTVRDGRVARVETYDCYEPFAAPDPGARTGAVAS